MNAEIESLKEVLQKFLSQKNEGTRPKPARQDVTAHATLSALVHHSPSQVDQAIISLLDATSEIKQLEHSRWMTQRRIATVKLGRGE